MANDPNQQRPREPRGFGEHTRGLSGEYAHEQGWGLDEEERTKQSSAPQDIDGGTDYEYGAADFGDSAVNTTISPDERDVTQNSSVPSQTNQEKR